MSEELSHVMSTFWPRDKANGKSSSFTNRNSEVADVLVCLVSLHFYQTREAVSSFHLFLVCTFLLIHRTHCDSLLAWDGNLVSLLVCYLMLYCIDSLGRTLSYRIFCVRFGII